MKDDERSRQALRESEERYRIVTEISRDVITVIDEAGLVTYVNPAMEVVFGYTPAEWVGRSYLQTFEFIHPE